MLLCKVKSKSIENNQGLTVNKIIVLILAIKNSNSLQNMKSSKSNAIKYNRVESKIAQKARLSFGLVPVYLSKNSIE